MRWLIIGVIVAAAFLLLAEETRQPGRLILPEKFEAKDYPNDAGQQILLVWSASPGDNTNLDEIDKRYKKSVEGRLNEWKNRIRDIVSGYPDAEGFAFDMEKELLKQVVEREPKIVYEIYISTKKDAPEPERKLLKQIESNEMSNLQKSKPAVFGKHPSEPFAHFFVVNVERVFCAEEAGKVDEIKSFLLDQFQIRDSLQANKMARINAEEEHLKLRAMLKLLEEAKGSEQVEKYNLAYWIEEMISEKNMALVEQLGETRQKALDLAFVELPKDATVGEKVVRLQRALENSLISSGIVYKSSQLGYYIRKEILNKVDEMERLLEAQKEETQKSIAVLYEEAKKMDVKVKLLDRLVEVFATDDSYNLFRECAMRMASDAKQLAGAIDGELQKKEEKIKAAEEAKHRYDAFVRIKGALIERIYSTCERLCGGTGQSADIASLRGALKNAEAEFADVYSDLAGAVILYRLSADGEKFMSEATINPEEQLAGILGIQQHPTEELSTIAGFIKMLSDKLSYKPEEGLSYSVFDIIKGNLSESFRLIERQAEALESLARKDWFKGVSNGVFVPKAQATAKAVKDKYNLLVEKKRKELKEAEKSLEEKRGSEFYFYLAMCRVDGEQVVERQWYKEVAAARAKTEWFNTNRINNLFFCVLLSVLVLYFIGHARRNPHMFIRKISGLDAVDEAVGRATEMGKPVFYLTGLGGMSDLPTIASVNILSRVARKVAQHDTRLRVPCYDPIVMSVAQEVYKEASTAVGRPDAYREDDVFYVTSDQFSYAAAVDGMMVREKPATIFLMGYFYAESLILAETGSTTGAIQIAGTDAYTQVPFFITTCDYTLIGEELYAASAYLSREPMLLGSLRGQDIGKAIFIIAIVIGTVFAIAGWDILQLLFTEY